ncbi:hypothetical protein GL325_05985 [Aeromicrobium sp. 636]|uniref:Uncharacterized protein n=1 Tax=Aeromicrobium senzhongii TaxID=2663859 RepID=A0A8I0K271_9ACTN|nr:MULTISPECIES: hypothetical protein [Aeromicrobium]MBC9225864.1 hypothetical protein [Aeromicrobium senzhongii]MCQ3997971.1 hypothetical protein [Aeromicrobium sp. 636]
MAKGHNARSHNSSRGVSATRLSQKSGSRYASGGYTKVNKGNGSFTMKKTGR